MKKKSVVFFVLLAVVLMSVVFVPLARAAETVAKVIVFNKTGKEITVYLHGKLDYQFTFPSGMTIIHVHPGRYTYNASGECSGLSGSVNITRGSEWVFKCKPGGLEDAFWVFGGDVVTPTPEPSETLTPEEACIADGGNWDGQCYYDK
jgi:hypothetical protein